MGPCGEKLGAGIERDSRASGTLFLCLSLHRIHYNVVMEFASQRVLNLGTPVLGAERDSVVGILCVVGYYVSHGRFPCVTRTSSQWRHPELFSETPKV